LGSNGISPGRGGRSVEGRYPKEPYENKSGRSVKTIFRGPSPKGKLEEKTDLEFRKGNFSVEA